jgi:hypothetical protein
MSVYVPIKLQRQIYARFGDRCAYCQTSEALMPVTFEFEHITPLSEGGKTVFENLCWACPTCNRSKASRQTGIDALTGELVKLFHPQRDNWTDHFKWSETGTAIEPQTPTGRVTIALLKMNRPQLINARQMWVDVGRHPPL